MDGTGEHFSQAQKAKNHIIPHMQIVDLKQMQSRYCTWVTHEGKNVHWRNGKREGNLKLECG
jgi:hypothetical protein